MNVVGTLPATTALLAERTTPYCDIVDFDACYSAHHKWVYHQCLRYGGGNTAWAEDVAHDVFVKLWKKLPELQDQHEIRRWLYRVTANQAISQLRRDRSLLSRAVRIFRARPSGPTQPAAETILEGKQLAAKAMHALAKLRPQEQAIICLKVLDGRTQTEIAEILDLSEGYVSKLLKRAHTRLRTFWENDVQG